MADASEPGPSVPPPLPLSENPVCNLCGGQPLSTVSQLPVCEPCRQKLIRRPLPLWIKTAAALIAILLMVAFVRFPAALWAGVHYERGQRLERAGKNDLAVAEYEEASRRYHTSTKLHLRFAVAAFKAGDIQKSAHELESLSGREVSRDEATEAQWLGDQFQRLMKAQNNKPRE